MLDSSPILETEANPRVLELDAEAPGSHILEIATVLPASEVLELESQRPIAELDGSTMR